MLLILSSLKVVFGFSGAKIGYFEGWDQVQIVMRSTYTVQQLLFFVSVNSDIDFDLIWGSFFTFWGPNGLFVGSMWGSKTVLGSTHLA